MPRRSDGGEGSRIIVQPIALVDRANPWSVATYPYGDPELAPDPNRATRVSEEKLYWRDTRTLAYRAGIPHYVDEEKRLVTRAQIDSPPPPKRPRGRPRRNPDDPKWHKD